jgi:beta-fructofuranosidase
MVLTLEFAVTFYTSKNLRDWTQTSVWRPPKYLGYIECPQILQIPRRDRHRNLRGSKWVLTLSLADGGVRGSAVKYIVGDFDGRVFTADLPEELQGGKRVGNVTSQEVPAESDYIAHELDFGPDTYATAFFHFIDGHDASRDAYSVSWAVDLSYACCTPTDRNGWRHCMGGARRHWIDAETDRLMSLPAGDTSGLVSERPGWNPILDRRGVTGVEFASSVIRNYNPAVEWFLVVRLRRSRLRDVRTATAQLIFQSSQSSNADTLSMRFDISSLSGGPAVGGSPFATFSMSRSSMPYWDRPGTYAVQELEALQHPSSEMGENDLVEFTLRGIMDRSILEVYVNGGVAAGTLLYFAETPMDSILLQRGAGSADAGVEFDFKLVALKSSWTGDA